LLRPELSPDGRKILFTDAGHDGVTAWTVGIDGTGARQVPGTRSQYDLLARWSPNGTRIAFVQDQSTLKVVSASGGSPRTIFAKPPANGHSGGISWLDW
jgi:tricorn protease